MWLITYGEKSAYCSGTFYKTVKTAKEPFTFLTDIMREHKGKDISFWIVFAMKEGA